VSNVVSTEVTGNIIDQLSVGVFVLDADSRIRRWNRWLQDKTAITLGQAIGKTIEELFPEISVKRFNWAVEQVIKYRCPQVLSQILNHYIVPIQVSHGNRHGVSIMQQHVTIAPMQGESDETLAVITIIDVTENVIRSSALVEMAQKLEHASNHDALTGVYNRRFMWEWLVPELKQCVRYKHTLSCLLLDIDHFKRLNDEHGHDKGDVVLKDFSTVVADVLRDSDFLIRYGGEEFVVLLPHCDLENAIVVAGRILDRMRKTEIGGMGKGEVLCSIGAASLDPNSACTGEELLKVADKRLYEAKNSGRNRVVPDRS